MVEQKTDAAGFQLISSAEELLHAMSRLKPEASEWLAVDAERASGFKYRQRAYLIQFHFESGDTWLVDPLLFDHDDRGSDLLTNFRDYLPKNWILHAATQDFPCLFELGLRPTAVFDSELAAKLLGMQRVGLASLLSELLGIELAKEHSAADWSIRPLSHSMLIYAAQDVLHLHQLKQELESRLEDQNRSSWAQEEFSHLLRFTPKPFDAQKWRKLPGIIKTNNKESFRIAKSLWFAREELAKELDISPGRVLPDRSIVAVAVAKPRTKSDLAASTQFVGRYSKSKFDLWWSAIEAAGLVELETANPEEKIPNHRTWERRFPEAHQRYQTLRPKIIEIASSLGLQPEVLVAPDIIREICFYPPQDLAELEQQLAGSSIRGWQRELLIQPLIEWLQGLGEKRTETS